MELNVCWILNFVVPDNQGKPQIFVPHEYCRYIDFHHVLIFSIFAVDRKACKIDFKLCLTLIIFMIKKN